MSHKNGNKNAKHINNIFIFLCKEDKVFCDHRFKKEIIFNVSIHGLMLLEKRDSEKEVSD